MPREPKHPSGRGHARPFAAVVGEPFVRLATLASRERAGLETPTYQERMGAMIKHASPPRELDGQALERQWQRLSRGGRATAGTRYPGLSLRWALTAALLLISSGIVAAETGAWTWPRAVVRRLTGAGRDPSGAAESSVPGPARRRTPGPRVVAANLTQPRVVDGAQVPSVSSMNTLSTDMPAPAAAGRPPASNAPAKNKAPANADPSAVSALALARARAGAPPLVEPPPAEALVGGRTVLAEESALLSRALVSLRQGHDAAAALVALDEYAGRYPRGTLAHEAQDARVDALLLARRWPEARAALAGMTLGIGARDIELRLIRAELAAETSCGAAFNDFQFVLAHGRADAVAERALWGRAACRSRMGDEAGARADLVTYVARFPGSPRAAAARARLTP